MESPQLFGGQEECHSSESGWTMYISSPYKDEDGQVDEESDNGEYDDDDDEQNNDVCHDDESEDSMASDASSGPSHRRKSGANVGIRGEYDFKNQENENDASKTAWNAMEKKRFGKRKKGKEEESVLAAKGAKFASQSNSSARKNNSLGKRK